MDIYIQYMHTDVYLNTYIYMMDCKDRGHCKLNSSDNEDKYLLNVQKQIIGHLVEVHTSCVSAIPTIHSLVNKQIVAYLHILQLGSNICIHVKSSLSSTDEC